MSFSEVFAILKSVIFDWRVIFITIAVLLYLDFIAYVIKYRRKPLRQKVRKTAVKAASPAAQSDVSIHDGNEEGSLA